ncbi:AraC family transcriptional regulator [Aurantibacter sp.]|uniref:helix-turn-helix domain-containing protein n=1 Tax=Aurantibacter sp. TaxID=2807103 RepID=UPI0032638635
MNKILESLKLDLLHTGHVQLDSNWDYDNVISPFSRIYLITDGNAKIFHSYEEVELKAGYIYLVPSFTYSRYKCDSFLNQYYVHFLEEIGNGLSVYDIKDFIYETVATDFDIQCFKRLVELQPSMSLKNVDVKKYDNQDSIEFIKKNNRLQSAAKLLETQGLLRLLCSRFIKNEKVNKTLIKSGFSDVLNYIKEHLHEDLTVSDLAKNYNLSADHFSRVFQQKFGIRPSKYIQTVRIERSETLLLTTNNTLVEIADKTGWNTVSYFTRMFKKINGKTPGQFRKERLSD